jgi:osmoprotectant transport system permease protein
MNDRQLLRRVQLPLAAPVIIAGIRTATVLVVGTATLATPVGGASLGNYIFSGLEMNNMTSTIFGCAVAAVLAVGLDQLVRLLEIAVRKRSRRLAVAASAALVLVVTGGLYGPIVRLFVPPAPVIASAPFTEQHILSEVLAGKLQVAGFRVDQRQGMGETIQFLALRHNQIDCCVNYTGNVWATLMQRKDVQDPQTTYAETTRFLHDRYGIVCLGRLGFENAYALAMPRARAAELGIHSIADLRRHGPRFRIAGDLQFFERSEWTRVCVLYGLSFRQTRPMDATLMYHAIADGSVDVICAYSSDGRILEKDLVILEDPAQAFPPYDAVLLLSAKAAADPQLRDALTPLVGAIDMTAMRRANLRVDVGGQPPRAAAAELLARLQG